MLNPNERATVHIGARVTPSLADQFRRAAAVNGCAPSQALREALTAYVQVTASRDAS